MKNLLDNINLKIHKVDFARVNHSWSRTQFSYPNHRIYYITDGEAYLSLIEKDITLKKDHMYLLPAFLMEKAICENTMAHHYLHFQFDSLLNTTLLNYIHPKLEVLVNNHQEIINLYNIAKSNYQQESTDSQLQAQGALQFLLAPFFENTQVTPDPDTERFSEVINYINNNITKSISNKTLANIMGLSEVYFSNFFSETFKIPPQKYIIKKRLELAQSLLINTDKKIKEIAREVGYDNEMYFSRLFKSKINLTPGEYREKGKRQIF